MCGIFVLCAGLRMGVRLFVSVVWRWASDRVGYS